MSTVLLDTKDLSEAEAVISATYGRVRLHAVDGTVGARIRRSSIGAVHADQSEYSADLGFSLDPMESIVLCRVTSGRFEETVPGGATHAYAANQVLAIGHHSEPIEGRIHAGRYDLLTIESRRLNDVATAAAGADEPIRLTHSAPISPSATHHLAGVIDYVHHSIDENSGALQSPLVAAAVERYVVASLLTSIPNTALLDPTIEDRNDSSPVLLRRAIAFIEDNAGREMTLADIAASVYITQRALQYMFRRHRNCTPMGYLRRVRLHHAHHDLMGGDPTTTSVGEIATRWGFGHAGRFAVYYRKHYGESPHQTLRR
jgi:AraC-like DNA-binding protein